VHSPCCQRGLGQRLQQHPHHPERHIALQLTGAGDEHSETRGAPGFGRRRGERRLADPGRPLDDDQLTVAGGRPRSSGAQGGDLALALDEQAGRSMHPGRC